MTEFMATTVIVAIIASLTYLIRIHPDNVLFVWGLLGFIDVVTLAGVYALFRALHEEE